MVSVINTEAADFIAVVMRRIYFSCFQPKNRLSSSQPA
jgi:hypothetical protein